jgi:hypothetical protein
VYFVRSLQPGRTVAIFANPNRVGYRPPFGRSALFRLHTSAGQTAGERGGPVNPGSAGSVKAVRKEPDVEEDVRSELLLQPKAHLAR